MTITAPHHGHDGRGARRPTAADTIEDRVLSDGLRPGDTLPPEADLRWASRDTTFPCRAVMPRRGAMLAADVARTARAHEDVFGAAADGGAP